MTSDLPKTFPKDFNKLIDKIRAYNSNIDVDIPILWKAYSFAKTAHKDHYRHTGEPYFVHLYQTAYILAELNMDTPTICAGFLHDVIEDIKIPEEVLKNEFTPLIVSLVVGVTKISDMDFESEQQEQAQNFRKMMLKVAEDIRVIIIKFADRLHNMRTLDAMPPEKQRIKSLETRDVYAPLAHRLGMYRIKMEMEDLSLKYLNPKIYKELTERINDQKKRSRQDIDDFVNLIQKYIAEENIEDPAQKGPIFAFQNAAVMVTMAAKKKIPNPAKVYAGQRGKFDLFAGYRFYLFVIYKHLVIKYRILSELSWCQASRPMQKVPRCLAGGFR